MYQAIHFHDTAISQFYHFNVYEKFEDTKKGN